MMMMNGVGDWQIFFGTPIIQVRTTSSLKEQQPQGITIKSFITCISMLLVVIVVQIIPASFYQNISSHKWDNDYKTNPNYRTSVHQIKVWAGWNLSGYNQELTSSKAHADNNWSDEHFDPPGNLISINDEVASLDMMYYVVAK